MGKQNWKIHLGNITAPLTWDGWFRRFEMQFLKTKVVFRNGLVLYKQNLIRTDLGNYQGFLKLAKNIFDSIKVEKNQENKLEG